MAFGTNGLIKKDGYDKVLEEGARLLSAKVAVNNVCCQQTFTVNKSAALPNGSDQQNLNWTKGRS